MQNQNFDILTVTINQQLCKTSAPQQVHEALSTHFSDQKTIERVNFLNIQRGVFIKHYWGMTKVHVANDHTVSFPNGITNYASALEPEKTAAIQAAFAAALPSMEYILGQSMQGITHEVLIDLQSLHPEPNQKWSGQFHQDTSMVEDYSMPFPLTTLVYYNHKNIHSEFWLRDRVRQGNLIHTEQTVSGTILSFTNHNTEHSVRNVHRENPDLDSSRCLLTFFYRGPLDVKRSELPIRELERFNAVLLDDDHNTPETTLIHENTDRPSSTSYAFILDALSQYPVTYVCGALVILSGVSIALVGFGVISGGTGYAALLITLSGLLQTSTATTSLAVGTLGGSVAALTTAGLIYGLFNQHNKISISEDQPNHTSSAKP